MITEIEALDGAQAGEIELAALWAAAAPENRGEEPAVLRACALNLLVLGASPGDLERARPIAARTILAHPSRVLLLAPEVGRSDSQVDPSERRNARTPERLNPSDGIGARISAFCHRLGGGERHVCCEEIMLLARGAAAERLPEAVLPLLLPDLPVFLWIPGYRGPGPRAEVSENEASSAHPPPCALHGRLSQRLGELANKVIWSQRGTEDHVGVSVPDHLPPAAIDLDWIRILPWRELTAQLFDAPDRRPLLERLEHVEITVAGPPTARPGAGWLGMGWLATRLGWDAVEGATGRSSVDSDAGRVAERRLEGAGGAVTAHVVSEEGTSVVCGELLAVRFRARGASEPLVLERHAAPHPTDLWITHGSARCVDLGIQDEATLLDEALGHAGRDPFYEAAWDLAMRLWAAR